MQTISSIQLLIEYIFAPYRLPRTDFVSGLSIDKPFAPQV